MPAVTLDTIPSDLLSYIFDYVGFGDAPGKNVACYRRISRWVCTVLTSTIRIEIDPHTFLSLPEFLTSYDRLYATLMQKRNECLQWNDYRGYLVIEDYDLSLWLYYDHLVQTYYFRGQTLTFPYHVGQMHFYEYP